MNIYISQDSTADLKISKIVKYLNSNCNFIKFDEWPVTFHTADKLIEFPETHNKFSQQLKTKLNKDEILIIITNTQYDNNYFYDECDNLVVLSFFGWSYLTSLPKENGLVYFICSMLIDEIVPYDAVDHTERLGCVNDFLHDKTRVDDGMRKGHLCMKCKNYIQKHKLSEIQSFLYNDILSMLRGLANASAKELNVISNTPSINVIEAKFNIKKSQTTAKNTGKSIFISYSHKDERERMKLEDHLKILQKLDLISIWTDRKITVGGEWKGEIDNNLKSARIVLMLISSNFMASDYCYDIEMSTALKRHEANETIVIPIILRDCLWQIAEFAKLQALPQDGKPIQKFTRKDEAYTSIARAIAKIIKGE